MTDSQPVSAKTKPAIPLKDLLARNEYLAKQHRSEEMVQATNQRLWMLIMGIFIACVVLAISALYQAHYTPPPRYIAVAEGGVLIEIPLLTEPFLNDQEVIHWAVATVTKSLSLDFRHFKRTLMEVEGEFTPEGFSEYAQNLLSTTKSGMVAAIEEQKLISSAYVDGATPIISTQGIIAGSGAYHWVIEFPVRIAFESSRGVPLTKNWLATVVVTRANPVQYPKGVAIRRINLNPK